MTGGQVISISIDSTGLLVKPEVARAQFEAEKPVETAGSTAVMESGKSQGTFESKPEVVAPKPAQPKRFHGTVQLNAASVGLDASRIAEEVIAHLAGQVGANVIVSLEIEAIVPDGASDQLVRTVTENSRTLKFTTLGFEEE